KLEQFEQNGVTRIDAEKLFQVVQKSGKPMLLLQDVSFVIKPRELVAIVGASGAGKSTLLNALTGFRPASTGSVRINGVDFYTHLELMPPPASPSAINCCFWPGEDVSPSLDRLVRRSPFSM